ncbi:hypothetical protein MATL_G00124880 [Megalops atlanticus]|uniref:Uncharacterized protein n=1 Tax=Megalops atlanticus TaxID=7932 RepID=A0A9D3PUI1_MEGAT|nr:hypothetical protein MATL_G00124880 [Megalops atlanticus]
MGKFLHVNNTSPHGREGDFSLTSPVWQQASPRLRVFPLIGAVLQHCAAIGRRRGCASYISLLERKSLFGFSCSTVRRGELMFSSASRQNSAYWHMKTSSPAGLRRTERSGPTPTSRTWSPIGEEKLRTKEARKLYFLSTKR